jgi:deoxynucleoside triphosphate triphosphohydrolase SAMHD1
MNMTAAWAAGLSPQTAQFLKELHQSVALLCAEYIRDLGTRVFVPEGKIIQDSLWGFIKLSRAEVVLIDSPLLQRLRYIRQLGFAYHLFPNASYSRFEHSLGVCHIVEAFARSLNEPHANTTPTIDEGNIQILRAAALLHDVGHLAFSHVSERALRHFPAINRSIQELKRSIAKAIPGLRKEPSTSEVLSVAICISPAVKTLLDIAVGTGTLKADIANLPTIICEYILGAATDPSRWFLAEMISGGMDADKLDYIPRDCMVTGVPLPFDVRRLILKTRLVAALDANHPFTRLAVSVTGARALMDLTVSRMMLQEKIYRHPKVLAAEAMFDDALAIASTIDHNVLNASNLLNFDDEHAWPLLRSIKKSKRPETKELQSIVINLQRRRLLKRAFVFSQFLLSDSSSDEHHASLARMLANEGSVVKLRSKIIDELKRILKITKHQLPAHRTTSLIAIGQVNLKSGAGAEQHPPCIVDNDGNIIDDQEGWAHLTSNNNWANAYEAGAAMSYVFGPEHLRPYVYAATRNVFVRDYGLIFKRPSALMAKISSQSVSEVDRLILANLNEDQKSEYRDILLACARSSSEAPTWRPTDINDEFLTALEITVPTTTRIVLHNEHVAVESMLQRVSVFDGPNGHRMSRGRLEAWLSQFDDAVQADALKLFLNLDFIDRPHFVGTFNSAISRAAQDGAANEVVVAPFTTSGEILKYYVPDVEIPNVTIRTSASISEAISRVLENGDARLVVIDDVLGSGVQGEDVLRIWHGEVPQHEASEVATKLSRAARGFLGSGKKITFCWSFALLEGVKRMRSALQSRHINGDLSYGKESSIQAGAFGADSKISFKDRPALLSQVQQYGEELLRARAQEKNWNSTQLKQRALGYSSASQLVVTPHNCPTITLPVLWAHGMVKSKEWIPLFRRRFRN